MDHLLTFLLQPLDIVVFFGSCRENQILKRDIWSHAIELAAAKRTALLLLRVSLDALFAESMTTRKEDEWLVSGGKEQLKAHGAGVAHYLVVK